MAGPTERSIMDHLVYIDSRMWSTRNARLGLSLVLAITCCAMPYVHGTFAPNHLGKFVLAWTVSVVVCIAMDGARGLWALEGLPIAMFPWGALFVACAFQGNCP
jgi:hypothetical protein